MKSDESNYHIDTVNILIGQLAVKEKLITPDQLRRAIAEQVSDLDAGRVPVRPLGMALVSLGFITTPQLLQLISRQHDRTRGSETVLRERTLVGQLLIRRGYVEIEQVAECLQIQGDFQKGGLAIVPRLGEILIRKGLATPEQVSEALAIQEQERAVGQTS